MSTFHLEIVTPDGVFFDGQADLLIVRTTEGDVGIMKGHVDYVAALGIGELRLRIDGELRRAACAGGFVSVSKEVTRIMANTFEWAQDIDPQRAVEAEQRARERIAAHKSDFDLRMAEMKLQRALNRQRIAGR